MTSRPGTAWAQAGADGVFEIPVHPDLPTILHLPDAITRARVTGGSLRVTFAGRTLHVRPHAGVSNGLEALLEVETMTVLLTFRLRVVERHADAHDRIVVVVLPSEQRAEQSPADGEAMPGPVASPEIPVHARVTTVLQFRDEIVRARFTGLVTGMMGATNLENRLLIRPRADLSVGDEVAVQVWTATVRQRFRLRVVRRAADAWRHVVVVAPAATASPATPTPPPSPATTLARALRMLTESFTATRDADAPERKIPPAPIQVADSAAAPRPVASIPGDGAASGTARAGAAARPRFAISIHAVAALAGTTELTLPRYTPTNARQRHRSLGLRVTGFRPGSSWGWEANVSGEWPTAPTEHQRENVRLDITGPLLRADAGLRVRVGTTWMPTFYVGPGLQAQHRDIEPKTPVAGLEETRTMPFRGVLVLSMGLDYRIGDVLLGLELHLRQGVPAEYRSTAVSLSVGIPLDQGE